MKKLILAIILSLAMGHVGNIEAFAQKTDRNRQSTEIQAYSCEEDWIEVMFAWQSQVRMRNGSLIDLSSDALQGTDQILNKLAWHQWYRLTDVPEHLIDQWETNGELNTGEDLYNLNNIYRLQVPKGLNIWEISGELEALPGILLARPVPKPVVPPSLLPPPGSFQSQQGYLNPASNNPSGVDAIYAWTQTGGTGSGVTICDLEYSWNYNHADITKAVGSQINPNPLADPFSNTNHGTAVIGELVANNNGWGTTGICYGSGLKTCGTYWPATGGWNVPGALAYAIASLSAGDIILLEQQWEYTSGLQNFIPIEWWMNYSNSAQTYNGVYAAIVTAIANGIHVVEAGGNGNVNTGSLSWYGDSGAIIVGAGGATTTNDRQRLSFSSYGPRFDLQGWGENIVTTGGGSNGPDLYNSEGPNFYYTNTFNGTSGASPIVTAALACTQGYYKALYSVTASPAYLRSHLATWGTAQVYGPSGNIGPRPNIKAAMQNIQPPQTNYDWGDAPDLPYPTLSTNNGAYHLMDGITYLGYSVDAENNGQPNPTATGDDINGINDDDGVVFISQLIPGQNTNVQVIASVSGVLNAWIDFNGLNVWSDPGEFIFQNTTLAAGVNTLTFFVPPNALPGNTIARFRFNTSGGILFYGNGLNGEVEDYQVLIGGGGQDVFDWGDAPDGPYPTLNSSNGARHLIMPGILLGSSIDSEPDGQPGYLAMGDDNAGMDDEDGVIFQGTMIPGQPANINVTVSVQGYLNVWFDFNNNGSWLDPGEHVFPDILIPAGSNPLAFLIPPTALPGQTYVRFRFSTSQGLSFIGSAPDGEVEDYLVNVGPQTEDYDWGDAPDAPYPTLGVSNGARHRITPGLLLGNSIDPEPDGQPEPMAMGDDNDILYPPVNDDEDGVVFTTPLISGQVATVNITASGMGALNAWIDFNFNGTWGDPGEQIFIDIMLNPGINILSFPVPPTATAGLSFARFRFSTMLGLSFTGMAPDGEVEDYAVNIEPQPEEFDWGDAPDGPYPTLGVSNGARHRITPGLLLGNSIDPEPDGQPEPMALGDDNDILYPPVNDDEDGVVFTTPLISGQVATVNIISSALGALNAWIDFNFNGTWGDPGEQIFIDIMLNPGINTLSFPVPPTATAGLSFARFRFSTMLGLSFTGMAPDGEVEDYAVNIEPIQEEYDWGDAPDAPYPTLGANNGAHHRIVPGFMLGNSIDPEPDGQPEPMALGDDNDILYPPVNDDEDGVVFTTPLISGQVATVNITASGMGALNAWIDFNFNGTWGDPGEQIFTDIMLNPGINTLSFPVPPTATAGLSFARFRFSTMLGLSFTGMAPDGEVEDYAVNIEPIQEEYDWGDAPDAPYPTLGANNGAHHRIVPGFMLGNSIDPEPDGQPEPMALGDDNDVLYPPVNDDEDGVVFTTPLISGQVATVNITASAMGALNAWIDFNFNGTWGDPGEQIFIDIMLNPGINTLSFPVPPTATAGLSFARFRFSTMLGLSFTGMAPDGEVEDYAVNIEPQPEEFDWGDAPDGPYPTLGASNGANHRIVPGFMLGNSIDPEPNGQPEPMALGDDNDILYPPVNDDEDGVVFTTPLISGQVATVNIIASAMGALNAWIDFNFNGTWGDPGEQIFIDIMLNPGINTLSFPVPPTATAGLSFARFRFSTMLGISFTGMAPDGEVEDYAVNIEPQPEEFDWGDAPDGPYPTLGASNGANHRIVPGFMLGNSIDPEPNGQPEPMALGDDNDILYPPVNDDEDGVVFTTPLISGQVATVNITASAMGALNAWIDFNFNGTWGDPGEQIFTDIMLNPGINTLSFPVPPTATAGLSFARFRFSTMLGLSFTGMAPDGEVEDYAVNIEPQPEEFDWGDAPDGPYPTLGASNGANHRIVPGFMLGNSIDPEPNGQPEPMALGDDNDILYPPVNDDEDGVVFTTPLISGQVATVNITASAMGALNAWIDFNFNGTWGDPGEQIFTDIMLNPGINTLSFPVPPTATAGLSFARFRFSTMLGLSFTGMAPDGEVEDYAVNIEPQPEEFDWGDAPDGPYPTLGASNGAHHRIVPGFMLGNSIDPEPDGQPEPMALGDDNDILYPPVNDDEDGVVFTTPLISGQVATVNIIASALGALNAWIDFNFNGTWGDPGEQIFTDIMLNPGINTLSFPVPPTATAGLSFARFRFSTLLGISFTGMAPDGEVEDYAVNIEPQPEEFDWGDAPDAPYPTLGVSNGANHRLDGQTYLGLMIDSEPDGQPDPLALGDDTNNVADEDGVQFNWPLLKGSPVMITVTVAGGGLFNGWIDFNKDGSWTQPNEHIFTDLFLNAGIHQLSFIVPANASAGATYARFRLSTQPGLSYAGPAVNGEVEDYMVMIEGNPELKWQQLPDAGRPGLHAHDYINSQGNHEWITMADDWLCNGGRVTDIHWWGNYELNSAQQEIKGAGISHFHLSIHANNSGNCLPVDPEVWGIDVPFNAIAEQFTGSLNNELSPVYLYEFTLPVPFQQIAGTRYWLDITAVSVNPNQNPHWRWQEAVRSNLPILCGAADKVSPVPGTWSTINWTTTGLFSDMAFTITNVPDKTLNLKFFLEGLYAGSGTMNKARDENGDHFAADTADVVTIELHDAADYTVISHTINNVAVNTSGMAVAGSIPYTINGNYYVTIIHRNSIETTTANPVSFAGNNISYDFSTAASQAYGSNQLSVGGIYMFYGGDVNQDGTVDTADMTPVVNDSANFASGYLDSDVNGDGITDTADITIVDNNAANYVGAVTP
ncbi:MAG: GEVED domain-containing protein [Lentimicrobium sp.]